jgi:nicotinamidase-related amidase
MHSTLSECLELSESRAPSSMALVVVDMQFFDAHRDWGEGLTAKKLGVERYFDEYFDQIDEITPTIAHLISLFRQKKFEVIHLRVAEMTQDSRDAGFKQIARGLIVPVNSKEAEFLPQLEPLENEIVINKSSSGVFASTNFDRILRNLNVNTLIFVGTSTGGCIQSAVYDATDLGYRVVIVSDACADATRESNIEAIAALSAQNTTVVDCMTLETALTKCPDVNPKLRSGIERVRRYTLSHPYIPNKQAPGQIDPYAAIFGPAVQLEVRQDNSAIIIVDAQRLTCDQVYRPDAMMVGAIDYSGYYERVPAALSKMAELLAAWRKTDVPIIHVRTAGQLPDGKDLSAKRRAQGIRAIVGSAEADFMPQVTPLDGEAIINKPASSIFNGTALDELLRNLGTKNIILAGTSIDGTIESSMRSSGDRGYGTLLVVDA